MTSRYKDQACKGCGKTFSPRAGSQKYCNACGPAARRANTDRWKADHPDANARHQAAHRQRTKDKNAK